jgi:hypothetical protein
LARPAVHDDRLLPATRALAVLVIPAVVVATFVLFVHPDDAGRPFAWLSSFVLASAFVFLVPLYAAMRRTRAVGLPA